MHFETLETLKGKKRKKEKGLITVTVSVSVTLNKILVTVSHISMIRRYVGQYLP